MKIKKIVEDLLSEDIRCRNDDKWLTYRVFQKIANDNGQNIFIPFNLFNKFPAFETIKRTRAKIQNKEGRLLPVKPILIKRGNHLEEIDNTRTIYANSFMR